MFSTNAEYEFFKEYANFSIGNFSDGWQHYNGQELSDNDFSREYCNRVSDLFGKFTLEIETNLVFLAESKPKTSSYLQKIEKKLEQVRDKLLDFHYLIIEDDQEEDGWRPIVWNQTQIALEKLINYCRTEFEANNPNKPTTNKKIIIRDKKLAWAKDTILLSKLYTFLYESKIIAKMPYSDFETHFLSKANKELNLEPINWQREKYLLIYLFDELNLKGFLDATYSSNCDILLSEHFTHKGKVIFSRQLSSARHTFKTKENKPSSKEKNTTHSYIQKCLINLFELSQKNKMAIR